MSIRKFASLIGLGLCLIAGLLFNDGLIGYAWALTALNAAFYLKVVRGLAQ